MQRWQAERPVWTLCDESRFDVTVPLRRDRAPSTPCTQIQFNFCRCNIALLPAARSIQDGFQILFPGQPTVTETTWKSEFDFMLPAHVYTAERGRERYSLTAVDYSGIEQQGIEHVETCAAGAEPCFGSVLSGRGYWKHDVRGALI